MSQGKIVQKTDVPATIDSLQSDFQCPWHQIGDGIVGSFILERNGLGVWRTGVGHHSASGGFGCNRNPCYAHPLNRFDRTEPVGKSACTRIVVDGHTGDNASLSSGSDTHTVNGVIAETFRKQKGTLRSAHPHHSFCAYGPQASHITDNHSLACGLGEGSPLARIYDLDGSVLLPRRGI